MENERRVAGMTRLIKAVQDLSLARSLDDITRVVRSAARELTGSDGATFVLRDSGKCFYVDEDAISPLWKGQRFPMTACISGWVMLNREPAPIEDIYNDIRVPIDAYRPTFVKSLLMVPIRTESPIGAIGNYWARRHTPSSEEIELVQALANTTSVAIENVQVYEELEYRVQIRTRQLEDANQELEAFSYSVSHDLRNPLSRIHGFASLLETKFDTQLDEQGRKYLNRIQGGVIEMTRLIEDMLRIARLSALELRVERVDLGRIARDCIEKLRITDPSREVEIDIEPDLWVEGDAGLLSIALMNLISNAWKYSSRTPHARITVGRNGEDTDTFFVRDNGAGFNPNAATNLFAPFRRLHADSEFPGSGIGLATVQRIVHRHDGRIWAEAEVGKGACFYFKLKPLASSARAAVAI